jgi:hypothetical protein
MPVKKDETIICENDNFKVTDVVGDVESEEEAIETYVVSEQFAGSVMLAITRSIVLVNLPTDHKDEETKAMIEHDMDVSKVIRGFKVAIDSSGQLVVMNPPTFYLSNEDMALLPGGFLDDIGVHQSKPGDLPN